MDIITEMLYNSQKYIIRKVEGIYTALDYTPNDILEFIAEDEK